MFSLGFVRWAAPGGKPALTPKLSPPGTFLKESFDIPKVLIKCPGALLRTVVAVEARFKKHLDPRRAFTGG